MYGTANTLHSFAWTLRRWAGASPMQSLVKELLRRGVALDQMDGLEVYGGDGTRHTLDYERHLRSLEVWEINKACMPSLKKNLPRADVRNVDSYIEINRTTRTYDFVVLDNAVSQFGPGHCFCEHFEMFDPVLRVLRPSAMVILNLLPQMIEAAEGESTTHEEHAAKRAQFYGVGDAKQIELERMVASYRDRLLSQGWELEWQFSQQRTVRSRVFYLVMKIRLNSGRRA